MGEKYYITTPIYYPSDKLHIGHAYCTTAADTMARLKRQAGYDVMFLTGTDEHGQKIEKIATEKGVAPQAYVDEIVKGIQHLWELMNISYDDFIRTTDPRHVECVQKIFTKLYEQGDIYKGTYESWYCTPCEAFWTDTQVLDGNRCPDCGREVGRITEEAYFFRASKYADRLIEHIESHPEFITPEARRNEMMNNFLLPGLEDLCVSRSTFKWGIPVPFDNGHILYVWIDALTNYISALGYLSDDESKFKKYWPADLHLVGKEIVRFHTITWPCILMALGLELPKRVYGHGWLTLQSGKISKSKKGELKEQANIVDPEILIARYGTDALRYFLMREAPLGSDLLFSNELLVQCINADLANDLGNLLSRTVAMVEKYFDGVVPDDEQPQPEHDTLLRDMGVAIVPMLLRKYDSLAISEALEEIWQYISAMNKYIDVTEPWILGRNPENQPRLASVLHNLVQGLRIVSVAITSVMPDSAAEMQRQLGMEGSELCTLDSARDYDAPIAGLKVSKGRALFQRIDVKKELAELAAMAGGENAPAPRERPQEEKKKGKQGASTDGTISIDDFRKVVLKTGVVLESRPLEGSDRLLVSKVRVGDEVRQIVSGIREAIRPEDLVGRTVIVAANLKSAKLRGTLSEGMLLAVGEGKDVRLLTVDAPDGLVVS